MKRIPTALHIIRLASQLGDYDSNVVGMAAEIIAEDRFGMRRVLRGTRDIDGFYQEAEAQRSVQVKGWSSSRVVKNGKGTFLTVRADDGADDLLVILFFDAEEDYEVLYKGPTDANGKLQKSQKNRYVRLDDLASGDFLKELIARCRRQANAA